MHYRHDRPALAKDPNLAGLEFDFGTFATLATTEAGIRLLATVRSRAAVIALVGAVGAAPSRPPIVAIEPLLLSQVGEAAFEREMKKFCGRLVRQIIEHLGGRWVRKGVRVTVESRFRKASIYDFGDRGFPSNDKG